jgi:hypothetical protein
MKEAFNKINVGTLVSGQYVLVSCCISLNVLVYVSGMHKATDKILPLIHTHYMFR